MVIPSTYRNSTSKSLYTLNNQAIPFLSHIRTKFIKLSFYWNNSIWLLNSKSFSINNPSLPFTQCSKHSQNRCNIRTLRNINHSSFCFRWLHNHIIIKNLKICPHSSNNLNNFPISLQRIFIHMQTFHFIITICRNYPRNNPKRHLRIIPFNSIIKRFITLIPFYLKRFIIIIFYLNSSQLQNFQRQINIPLRLQIFINNQLRIPIKKWQSIQKPSNKLRTNISVNLIIPSLQFSINRKWQFPTSRLIL